MSQLSEHQPGSERHLDEYRAEHRPDWQDMVDGDIPLNPLQRIWFDATPHDRRDPQEVQDWWKRPYIQTFTLAQHLDMLREKNANDAYLEDRVRDCKAAWHMAWPEGTRYEVRALDGADATGSTCWGITASLADAIRLVRAGPRGLHHRERPYL